MYKFNNVIVSSSEAALSVLVPILPEIWTTLSIITEHGIAFNPPKRVW